MSGFQPNQKTDTKGFIFELVEGVRTEELSGSNLHKLSKSSYQKRTKSFFTFFTIIITNKFKIVKSKMHLFSLILSIISVVYRAIQTPKIG